MQMLAPHQPQTSSLRADLILFGAVACLWVFAAGVALPRAVAEREILKTALFLAGSIAFLLISCGPLRPWYGRRGFRGYFLHQILALGVAVIAFRQYGPVWLLVLPATCQAVMVLPVPSMIVVLAGHLALAAANLTDISLAQVPMVATNILSSFCFTVGCSYVIRRERDSRAQLAVANEKLKAYAEQVQGLAVAEERNRLATEIHDGAAHHLTSANMLVAAGIAVLADGSSRAALEPLQKAQGQIRAALAELRAAVAGRFDSGPPLPLVERIQGLIAAASLPVDLTVTGSPEQPALRPETQHALYRVAQEALTNASKHAPGARVSLRLDFSQADRAKLWAENDEPAVAPDGDGAVGLLSLRDRIHKLGGTFHAGRDRTRQRFVVQAEVSR